MNIKNSENIRSFFSIHQTPTSQIPEEFGKQLSDLFHEAKYEELIQKIDNSEFKTNPDLLDLKSLSYQELSESYAEKAKLVERQSKFFRQHLDDNLNPKDS